MKNYRKSKSPWRCCGNCKHSRVREITGRMECKLVPLKQEGLFATVGKNNVCDNFDKE